MAFESEIDVYVQNLCGHVSQMVWRLRQIPPELFDYQPVAAAPSPRIIANHTYQWLVCDRAHINDPDARAHAKVPEPPQDQTALCDALYEENEAWRELLKSLTPEMLLAERKQFNEWPMNVRGFVGHMLQNCIYKNGQLATIFFSLGLDGTEPYDAPWPNTFYDQVAAGSLGNGSETASSSE